MRKVIQLNYYEVLLNSNELIYIKESAYLYRGHDVVFERVFITKKTYERNKKRYKNSKTVKCEALKYEDLTESFILSLKIEMKKGKEKIYKIS